MFDAKALLEQLAGNPHRSGAAPSAPEGGGLADLVRNMAGGTGGAGMDQILAQVKDQAAKFGGPSGAELVDTLT